MAEYLTNGDAIDEVHGSPHYVKHVSAMMGEGLHHKSDIAVELARRDMEIDSLKEEMKGLAENLGLT